MNLGGEKIRPQRVEEILTAFNPIDEAAVFAMTNSLGVDELWALVEPLLSAVKPGGRPEAHPRREVVNAILYLLRTGCSWRQLPKDFPPWETVYWHFKRWPVAGSTRVGL